MAKRASIDEFMERRKGFVGKAGPAASQAVIKGFRAPSSWDAEKRTGNFTMSTESKDRDGDIIRQAGLDMETFLANPIAPAFHMSWQFPIGKWENVTKMLNGRPKRTEGTLRLLPEGTDPDCDRAAVHLSFGTIRAVSIGFRPKEVEYREKDDDEPENYWGFYGFDILEAELLECSLVAIPANAEAMAKSAVAGGTSPVLAKAIIEEVLDTWVKTPAGVVIPRAEYERAYFTLHGKSPEGAAVALKGEPERATDQSQDDGNQEKPGLFTRLVSKVAESLAKESARTNADITAQVEMEARLVEATAGGEPVEEAKTSDPVDQDALRARARAVRAMVQPAG